MERPVVHPMERNPTDQPERGQNGPIVLSYVRSRRAKAKSATLWNCTRCGYRGQPSTYMRGTRDFELILWMFGILPGVVYSLWRRSTRFDGCPNCRSKGMIPLLGQPRVDFTDD